MVAAIGALWSAERTRDALGLTDTEVVARRSAGALLGVQTADDSWFYPLAQFEPHDGGVRVRPGLAAFLEVLRDVDPWTVAMAANTPAEELEGRSPVEWARDGKSIDTLIDYAYVLRGEWSTR